MRGERGGDTLFATYSSSSFWTPVCGVLDSVEGERGTNNLSCCEGDESRYV